MGFVEDVQGSKRISNEGREAQSCQACAFKMGQPKVGEGPLKLLQAPKRVMPEGSKLGSRNCGGWEKLGEAAKRLRSEYSRVSRSTSPWVMGRVKRVMMAKMAKMAKMGEYWGMGRVYQNKER